MKKIPERLRKLWGGVKSFFISSKLLREEPPAISAMDIRKTIEKWKQDINRYKQKQQEISKLAKQYKDDGVKLAAPGIKPTLKQQTLAQSLKNFRSFRDLIDTKTARIAKLEAVAKKLEKAEQAQAIATTERFPIAEGKASLISATDPLIDIATAINKAQAELKTLQEKERAANEKVKVWEGYAAESAQNSSANKHDLHRTNLSGFSEATKELQKIKIEIKTKKDAINSLIKLERQELGNQQLAKSLASQPQTTNLPPGSLSSSARNSQRQNGQPRIR